MFRLIIGIALALALVAPSRSLADPTPASNDLWRRSDNGITFTRARFAFPARAGAVALEGAYEFSHPGQGLDSGLQYESADHQIFASVYVYAPSLPQSGLTAFTTDNAIRVQSGSELRLLASRTVAAGGHPGVAIRADYFGFRQARIASSAAFIRAGLWIVKLRVSGPEARRTDIEATMTALLDTLRFEGNIRPLAAAPLVISDCAARSDPPAAMLAHVGADTLEDAVFDVSNSLESERRPERPGHETNTAFPSAWCLSARAHVGNNTVPILRALPYSGSNMLHSVLVAMVTDSGTLFRVIENRERHIFIAYYHQIGRTLVLGRYRTIPTDEQIVNILSGADREGGNARATITYPGDGSSTMTINEELTAPASPVT
ncbi:MAG TPA: hypothetical protein VIT38_10450 [Allosphingosinicella sp.]